MTTPVARSAASGRPGRHGWRRQLLVAAGCAAARGRSSTCARRCLPVPVATVGLGVGLVGCVVHAGRGRRTPGRRCSPAGWCSRSVALVTVLPEFVIEIRFAFIQEAELVTANLTGATRLLLAGAIALPLLVAFLARTGPPATAPIAARRNRRLELGILLVASSSPIQIVVRGSLTVVDAVVLVALYVALRPARQGTPDEEPAVVGVAAGLLSLPPRYRRPAIAALIVVAGRRRRHDREPVRRRAARDRDRRSGSIPTS